MYNISCCVCVLLLYYYLGTNSIFGDGSASLVERVLGDLVSWTPHTLLTTFPDDTFPRLAAIQYLFKNFDLPTFTISI